MVRQRLAAMFGLMGGILTSVALYMAFFVAPEVVTAVSKLDYSQKVFYIHTPVAEVSLLSFLVAGGAGIAYLVSRDMRYDFLGKIAIELGLIFGVMVELSGIVWNRMAWGLWWTWDPKLTVYLIALLFFAAYFVLRAGVEEQSARARYGAVYAIVGAVNAPLTFFANRVIPSPHPVLFKLGQQIDPSIMATFLLSMVGMACLYICFLLTRLSMEEIWGELEAVKDRIGGW